MQNCRVDFKRSIKAVSSTKNLVIFSLENAYIHQNTNTSLRQRTFGRPKVQGLRTSKKNPIPWKETARTQSQFPHSCFCERFIYFHDRSTCFPAAEQTDRSQEYINRSKKHECRNWDCGRPVSFLGIFVSNFRYTVFAVRTLNIQAVDIA